MAYGRSGWVRGTRCAWKPGSTDETSPTLKAIRLYQDLIRFHQNDDDRTALLDALVDYAGLFPPAAIDMPAAAGEYARHRSGPMEWMLSRYI